MIASRKVSPLGARSSFNLLGSGESSSESSRSKRLPIRRRASGSPDVQLEGVDIVPLS